MPVKAKGSNSLASAVIIVAAQTRHCCISSLSYEALYRVAPATGHSTSSLICRPCPRLLICKENPAYFAAARYIQWDFQYPQPMDAPAGLGKHLGRCPGASNQ
jgi:hypothetical protein